MLCNSKKLNRPDKTLQTALFKLSFILIMLTFSLIAFFLYPQYHLYTSVITSVITIYCLLSAIQTLNAGEAAISYGGFANEIIRNDSKSLRIENPRKESVLENLSAKKLFGSNSVLSFLEHYLSDSPSNKSNIFRLENALKNLTSEKVTLSLILKQDQHLIFNNLEYFEVSLRPIYLKKPQIFEGAFSVKRIKSETYFYWSVENVTAKHNMDYIFNEESTYLHNFLDDLPIGLYTIDKNYNINYVNKKFAEILGMQPHQLISTSLQNLISSASSLPLKKDFWSGTINFITPKENTVEAYVFQSSYREKEQIMLRGAVVTNLPTSQELQLQVNKSLDEVNWLFNNSPIGILFIDYLGNIIDKNPKSIELFNLSSDSDSKKIFDYLSVENTSKLQASLTQATLTKTAKTIELKLADCTLNLYIVSLRLLHQTSNSDTSKYIIYAIDNTKQKELEAQFSQAQKMQAVGQLAGGVAHDFNNLLTAMIGFTDLLLQRHGVGDPSFADLIQIKQNANRAASLVRQLLAFSRKQPLLPKLIDITENFTDLNQMLKRILGEKIKLVFHHGKDLGYVKVDPNQFSQVIVNLAVNAKDAMNGNGTLNISTDTFHLSEDYTFGEDIISKGDFVVINVSDSGCGIKPENLSRIFDPFFSTKKNIVGSGTGLGLAMVYGIVRQTEGFIKVDSTLGQGTTFSIYLPRFENAPEDDKQLLPTTEITNNQGKTILKVQETLSAPANINQKIIMGLNISNSIDRSHSVTSINNKTPRILFVEDEDSVRSFAVRALKKKGYEIIDSDSAETALDILSKDQNFDLLVTDMMLPGISGAQLTNKVKEQMPDLSVILASGYSEDIARQEVNNTHEFDFITKPYSLGDLTAKVFDVLNRKHHDK